MPSTADRFHNRRRYLQAVERQWVHLIAEHMHAGADPSAWGGFAIAAMQ